ncbi:hypothetical protein GCM10027046_36700 [Uliginosibacterium flavum]|uniref:Uncharacterized protein n=1 Tax=Uliginosibacterium flavum TaxID=1396831 RepID=A0ABV2TM89_9RHOO
MSEFDSSDTEQPSYLKELLFSQSNVLSVLAGTALAIALSFPFGAKGFILPMIGVGTLEALAALFIPTLPSFRSKVDARLRAEKRNELIAHLRGQIEEVVSQGHANWSIFERLQEKTRALRELQAVRGERAISERDVERVADAAVQFLSNWLVAISIESRLKTLNRKDLEVRRSEVGDRLTEDPSNSSLKRALRDIEELLERRERLINRRAAVEAGILALPDAVEEIMNAALTSRGADDASQRLQEAVNRLHEEEEAEALLEQELKLPNLASKQRA